LIVGKLSDKSDQEKAVLFHWISRNRVKDSYKATEEEKLIEVVNELTYHLEEDLSRGLEADGQDILSVLYLKFCEAVKVKAEQFKEDKGYRRLCCVPSFILGLAMAGRAGRHYKHCSWFTIGTLSSMLGEYGGVGVERDEQEGSN